jgi:hypothetical protein
VENKSEPINQIRLFIDRDLVAQIENYLYALFHTMLREQLVNDLLLSTGVIEI